ncbi:MAG: PKD domain-containing protein, partial [Deltaproteobacteria bacterium]|nr:PKD domain-containing protein [Deltaproteobacteria bacterium]
FFGLDHCQINSEYVADGSTVNDAYVPTMYPTATDDDTTLGELNPDDVAAVTMLYPASNVDSYYGRIEGTVIRADGSPVLGANVVAVQVGDEQLSRFSSVSDYYMRNTGAYDMLVTPGSYKLFMEPIDETFTSGSSVGPYAQSAYDQSFIEPVIVEYYNGASESSKESDLNAYETITVSAGETVTGIGFVAEGEAGSTTTTTTIDAGSTTTTTISGDSAVSVAFSADPLSGAIPLTVEFSNQTTGLVDYYLWDFGDGSISLEENTFHTYTSPGLFTVTLTANASDGTSETLVKEHYVSVSICSFRSFVADRRQLAALHKVRTRLAGSPSGAFLIGLYYCYTAEISSVLVLQPALQQKVEQLIEKNIAYACKLANVGTVVVPAAGMRELQEVLQELGSHGGTGLRAALAMIRASLKSETFLA